MYMYFTPISTHRTDLRPRMANPYGKIQISFAVSGSIARSIAASMTLYDIVLKTCTHTQVSQVRTLPLITNAQIDRAFPHHHSPSPHRTHRVGCPSPVALSPLRLKPSRPFSASCTPPHPFHASVSPKNWCAISRFPPSPTVKLSAATRPTPKTGHLPPR